MGRKFNSINGYIHDFIRKLISLALTQESGNTVNFSIFKFKQKQKWLFYLIYGSASDEEIFNQILKKLNGKFDVLMIHSSFNGMVPMYKGNLNKLLSLLLVYCKQNNITLAMPTFLHVFNYEAVKYYEKRVFDYYNTTSGMGLLTELFRRKPDIRRSIHPTHSICAYGPLSEELTKDHHLADTTFGEGTPFGKMADLRTIILGIGTNHRVATQVHSAEDILKNEYPLDLYSEAYPVVCIDESGNEKKYNIRIRKQDYVYDMKTVDRLLKSVTINWTYKGIRFFLTKADRVNNAVIEAAKKGQTIYKLN